jgi:hypothetical protein
MPLYSSKCMECGKSHTYYKSVAERADTPLCHDKRTFKTLDAPMIGAMSFSGHKGFEAPGAQKWIEDGASMKKYMRENNYISESEGHQEANIQLANREAADDRKLDTAVTNAVLGHAI